MTLYSQRDTRWKDEKLGYGSTTIGNFGCTISALSQLLLINGYSETPSTVNAKLKANAGFVGTNQNLLVWTAIEKAFKAKHLKRAYSYNNTEVADAISKYGGCLVEVDGSRIGAPTHWVLYIGNQKMIDPWTGTEQATSYYPPKGYSIISVEKNTGGDMTMTVPKTEWERLRNSSERGDRLVKTMGMTKNIGDLTNEEMDKLVADYIKLKADLKSAQDSLKKSEEEKLTAIDKAYNEGVDAGKKQAPTLETPPEQLTANGSIWVLNGLSLLNGRLEGNYKRSNS